ncbi:MAG: response regulator transcription factor [Pirellulaceae bacterium]
MLLRILVVDDHEAVREGLEFLLSGSEISVAASCSGGSQALVEVESQTFDAVLLDVRLADGDGHSLLAAITAAKPDMPVIMFSAYDNPTYIARAAALGAADYLLKGDSKQRIIEALTDAASGKPPAERSNLSRIEKMMRRDTPSAELPPELPLTPREVQVIRHIGLGLSNKEISKSLTISVETVKEHVQNILRKAGATDRTDAAVQAVRLGLVD